MLRAALKVLAYLSILTSTRTSSSYLEPQSLVSFRRAALSDEMAQQQPRPVDEWRGAASFYMPRVLNANSELLFAQPQPMISTSNNNKNLISKSSSLNSNSRRANKKSRKSKKQQQQQPDGSRSGVSKQLYESHSKRRNGHVEDDEVEQQQAPPPAAVNSNSSANSSSSGGGGNNDYPTTQVDAKQARELQELFGLEGARKYQEYQLQQRMLTEQLMPAEQGAGVEDEDGAKEQVEKRDGSLGAAEEMQDVSGAMINQMMSRTTRRQREYDVPLIREC
jgi:hypothetical protein